MQNLLSVPTTTEQWQVIANLDGRYLISESGLVYDTRREKCNKAFVNDRGYYKIGLRFKGTQTNYMIHKLVAIAFIPNPENKPQVNHIDGVKTNNHVSNLEWCTQSENIKHAYRTGLAKIKSGSEVHTSVFQPNDIRLIRSSNLKDTELAEIFGVWPTTIRDIRQGISYKNLIPG
jgi:hypothetical protein